MSPPSLVVREDVGPVAVLTLNRPEKRNALSRALVAELSDALDRTQAAAGVRAVVVAANGPTFCAGMDLKEAAGLGDSAEDERRAVEDTQAIADLIDALHRGGRPTIAAVQGDALAGGAGVALACDFVVAAPDARIGYPEVLRGLVAAIVLHDLARQVGDRRARQLLLTGEPIRAEQAERWGLVNELAPADRVRERAVAIGRALAQAAPIALATTKRLLDEATRRPADLRGAAAVSAAIRCGDEAAEGMRAFLEKREARWRNGSP